MLHSIYVKDNLETNKGYLYEWEMKQSNSYVTGRQKKKLDLINSHIEGAQI